MTGTGSGAPPSHSTSPDRGPCRARPANKTGTRAVAPPRSAATRAAAPQPQPGGLLQEASEELLGAANRQHRSPESCGCGLMLRVSEEGELVVDGVLPGGPADKTGKLRLGDTLVRVDRQYVHGLQPSQIVP